MAAQGAIRFDDTHSPIVVVEFHGTPTDAEFDQYLAHLTRRLARSEPHLFVIDNRSGAATARQSRLQGEWMKENYDAVRRLTTALVFVSDSPLVRISLSIIFMIQKLPCEYRVTNSIGEAMRWARDMVARQGRA